MNAQAPTRKNYSLLRAALWFAALSGLTACAHDVDVSYNCTPLGAEIYQEGIGSLGTCPMIVKYSSQDIAVQDNQLHIPKTKVIWASNTTLLIDEQVVDIPRNNSVVVTFIRPTTLYGTRQDTQYAAIYGERLVRPEIRYVTSPEQNRSFFAALNADAACGLGSLFDAAYAQCPK